MKEDDFQFPADFDVSGYDESRLGVARTYLQGKTARESARELGLSVRRVNDLRHELKLAKRFKFEHEQAKSQRSEGLGEDTRRAIEERNAFKLKAWGLHCRGFSPMDIAEKLSIEVSEVLEIEREDNWIGFAKRSYREEMARIAAAVEDDLEKNPNPIDLLKSGLVKRSRIAGAWLCEGPVVRATPSFGQAMKIFTPKDLRDDVVEVLADRDEDGFTVIKTYHVLQISSEYRDAFEREAAARGL